MIFSSGVSSVAQSVTEAVAGALSAVPVEVWTHLAAAAAGALALALPALLVGEGPGGPGAELRRGALRPGGLTYSPLEELRAYEGPDSVRVDTVLVPVDMPQILPASGGPSGSTGEGGENALETPVGGGLGPGDVAAPTTTVAPPSLGYITVPLQEGRPSVEITEERATLSGFSPRSGRGLQYEYDVSRPTLTAGPAAWADRRGVTPGAAFRWRFVRLSVGYAPWREDSFSGRLTLSYSLTLID